MNHGWHISRRGEGSPTYSKPGSDLVSTVGTTLSSATEQSGSVDHGFFQFGTGAQCTTGIWSQYKGEGELEMVLQILSD